MLWLLTWLMRRLLQALRLAAPVRVVRRPAASAGHSSELAEKKRTGLDVGRILSQCPSLTGPDAWYLPTPWLARCVRPDLTRSTLSRASRRVATPSPP